MRVENGIVVLEKVECKLCDGTGMYNSYRIPCPTCKGTRRGKRGGVNGCKDCYDGTKLIIAHDKVCHRCNGTKLQDESICDYTPDGFLATIPIKVFVRNANITFNEAYLGFGCLWSCEDYGRSWDYFAANGDEQEWIEKNIRKEKHTQICNIAHEDTRQLCSYIGVFVNKGGYSVRAVYETPEEALSAIANERDKDSAMMIGSKAAELGLNGTIIGAFRK